MSALIDRMKAHFTDLGVQSVEVPEWGEDGKPLVIYFSPMTLAEKQRLVNVGEREGYVARLADALIMKAMDADGKKLFTVEHKVMLRNHVDPEVLARVVARMMLGPSAADMGKDSSRTEISG